MTTLNKMLFAVPTRRYLFKGTYSKFISKGNYSKYLFDCTHKIVLI